MNTQPSSQPPVPGSPPPSNGLSLRMVEKVTRQTQRIALGWGVVSAIAFIVATIVPEALRGFIEFIRWLGLVVALLYAGRWIQSTRLEHWLRYQADQADDGTVEQDWSSIPSPTPKQFVRSYASVSEAAQRGWAFGQEQGIYDGQPVPAWAEMEGQRFVYDGLSVPNTAGAVPENVRLFGRLRYVNQKNANEEVLPEAIPAPQA